MTTVSEIMTRGVRTMSPSETVAHAAQAMHELNVGSLPVCSNNRLVGILTDRDIVVRGVAQGLGADTPVKDLMSPKLDYCYEDQPVQEVMDRMRESKVRRLPVLDKEDQLVGIVSLGDVATNLEVGESGGTLAEISEPSRPDRSNNSAASGDQGGGETQTFLS
ncbi:CBS domain-containing protein [Variovorax sp. VNK109]|uniref:CBS domain-containing protein n=1 Tax=Variovorax sp. VNK109 TaxID=3400919 RepID=UPI003C0E48A9